MRQPSIALLNVGDGDTKLTFDKNNMAERIRSARIVTDMLRRGYTLIIEPKPGQFQKVKEFREDVCEYIIADLDPEVAAAADRAEAHGQESGEAEAAATADEPAPATPRRGGKRRTKSVSAEGVRGVAIAPTAGG